MKRRSKEKDIVIDLEENTFAAIMVFLIGGSLFYLGFIYLPALLFYHLEKAKMLSSMM